MKWLLDCDPGVDDFLALNLLAPGSPYRSFEADCLAYVSVNGNCDLQTASSNLALAHDLFQLSAPIYEGRALPLKKEVRHGFFHGKDGLLGQAQALEQILASPLESAYPDLVSLVERLMSVDEFVLVTTGPLTNWGWIFSHYPELRERVVAIYSMGGSLSGGNVSPYAEANYFDDPEALAIVLETRIPFHMISLDLTRQFYFQSEDLSRLQAWAQESQTGESETLRRLSAKMYLDYASKDSALHDPLALLAFFDPEALEPHWTTIGSHRTGEREGEVYRDPAGFPACVYDLRKRDALMNNMLASIEALVSL